MRCPTSCAMAAHSSSSSARSTSPRVTKTCPDGHEKAPTLPVFEVRTMRSLIDRTGDVMLGRILAGVLALFGVIAVLLAALGLYGVISYSVSRRTREIGVRVALGARPRDVLGMILGQGMRTILIGIAIGTAGSLALTRGIRSLLFGVTATDPLTLIAVILLLFVTALLACFIPARRATKVDPMVALRYE